MEMRKMSSSCWMDSQCHVSKFRCWVMTSKKNRNEQGRRDASCVSIFFLVVCSPFRRRWLTFSAWADEVKTTRTNKRIVPKTTRGKRKKQQASFSKRVFFEDSDSNYALTHLLVTFDFRSSPMNVKQLIVVFRLIDPVSICSRMSSKLIMIKYEWMWNVVGRREHADACFQDCQTI